MRIPVDLAIRHQMEKQTIAEIIPWFATADFRAIRRILLLD